jgi:signal transduction histidine kinase
MAAGAKMVLGRMLIWVLPIQLLVLVGFQFWLYRHLRADAASADLALARQSQLAVVHAIQATEVSEAGHEPWDRLVDRVPRNGTARIDILAPTGKVLYSADPSTVNRQRELDEAPCRLCHLGGVRRPSVENAVLRSASDASYQFYAGPLWNHERCLTCHGDQGNTLGMVLVGQGLRPLGAPARTAQLASGLVALVVLASTFVLTRHYAASSASLDRSQRRVESLQRELRENERLAGVGQTVAGLSHTLKNVLNGLRAGRFVVDRAMRTKDERKLRKGLRVTRSSVRMVERLIFDMLHYAKDRTPQRELLDPNEIIREVISELRQMAGGWGIELQAELDQKIGHAALDRIAIYRALVDLATNAIEACTEIESGTQVVLGSRGEADSIVLTVRDNGVGMTQEVLASLYTRFISTKATGGTGLGMVVVKKIVDEHEGTIDVESCPGKGTTFCIRLPRSSAREPV